MVRARANSPAAGELRQQAGGEIMPLMLVGLNVVGVTPLITLRSNVSVWLGAPASRMKITFLAVFFGVAPAAEISAASRVALGENTMP